MTRSLSKQFIAFIGIVLAISGLIFGSILPLAKAKLYIKAMERLQSVKNLDEFKQVFNVPLDFYSPVGQEEVVRFLAGDIFLGKMIQPGQSESISRELMNYIEPKIIQNQSRHLLLFAWMYGRMFDIYKNEEYLRKSEEYFRKMLILNPKSPQALHALLDIGIRKGDRNAVKETGETILKYWPEDEKIKEILKSF